MFECCPFFCSHISYLHHMQCTINFHVALVAFLNHAGTDGDAFCARSLRMVLVLLLLLLCLGCCALCLLEHFRHPTHAAAWMLTSPFQAVAYRGGGGMCAAAEYCCVVPTVHCHCASLCCGGSLTKYDWMPWCMLVVTMTGGYDTVTDDLLLISCCQIPHVFQFTILLSFLGPQVHFPLLHSAAICLALFFQVPWFFPNTAL